MTKLTEMQTTILTKASNRADGFLTRPGSLHGTAAVKVAAKLLDQALVQEVPAKLSWPIWRMDKDGRAFSLKILKAGRMLVQSSPDKVASKSGPKDALSASTAKPGEADARASGIPVTNGEGKPGGKREIVLGLLQRQGGASIGDLMAATGWLPHSTRAALTGLRKTGLAIERSQHSEDQTSVYRIVPVNAAEAA